jgi:cytoskeleton protein RodZ
VGSYARLLGLPESLADEVVRGKPAPQLAPIGKDSPSRGALDRGVMNLAYLAMTVVIVGSVVMLAMYFQGPRRTTEVLPLDPPAAIADAVAPGLSADGLGRAEGDAGLVDNSPVMASLAPSLDVAATAGREFVLQFKGASWVEAVGHDGVAMEKGMVAAGSRRNFSSAQLSRLTLGDSSAVDVTVDGVALDLAPYREANIARFAVSSEGEVSALPRD